jgi:hypothetical protein
MSGWVVLALTVNAALVGVAIVYAVRLAGRGVVVAVELELQLASKPVTPADSDERWRLPLFTAAQMNKTEWRALLESFDAARAIYLKELTAWRNGQPRAPGTLSQALHDLDVARDRLNRFEREVSTGIGREQIDGRYQRLARRASAVG